MYTFAPDASTQHEHGVRNVATVPTPSVKPATPLPAKKTAELLDRKSLKTRWEAELTT